MTITLTREEAQQVLDALDLAQALCEKSSHHGRLLREYENLCALIEEVEKERKLTDKEKTVYDILCSDEAPPKGHHWEGFAAAKIVKALAQPEPEPVAWMCSDPDLVRSGFKQFTDKPNDIWNIPVYTAPPQRECAYQVHDRREWQGLTDEEIDAIGRNEWVGWPSYDGEFTKIYRVLEDKLKEKNDLATTKS